MYYVHISAPQPDNARSCLNVEARSNKTATSRKFLALGAVFAMLAIVLGALGAHALKQRPGADPAGIWHTAVEYQFYHALGLVLVGTLAIRWKDSKLIKISGWLMAGGILFFCGSLYALVWSGHEAFGFITPIGGIAFIFAWLLLAIAAWRNL